MCSFTVKFVFDFVSHNTEIATEMICIPRAARINSRYFTKMMTNDQDHEIRTLTKVITKPSGSSTRLARSFSKKGVVVHK